MLTSVSCHLRRSPLLAPALSRSFAAAASNPTATFNTCRGSFTVHTATLPCRRRATGCATRQLSRCLVGRPERGTVGEGWREGGAAPHTSEFLRQRAQMLLESSRARQELPRSQPLIPARWIIRPRSTWTSCRSPRPTLSTLPRPGTTMACTSTASSRTSVRPNPRHLSRSSKTITRSLLLPLFFLSSSLLRSSPLRARVLSAAPPLTPPKLH